MIFKLGLEGLDHRLEVLFKFSRFSLGFRLLFFKTLLMLLMKLRDLLLLDFGELFSAFNLIRSYNFFVIFSKLVKFRLKYLLLILKDL